MMKSFQAACHILKTHAAAVAETTSQKTKMKMKKWSVKSPVDTYTRRRNRTGCHSLLADTEKDSDTLPLELVVEDAEEDEDQKLAVKLQRPQHDNNDLDNGES